MEFVRHLACVQCGAAYPAVPAAATCPACGIAGILDVVYDYDAIAARWKREEAERSPDPSLWRFSPLLPVDPATPRPPLRTGGTPLLPAPRLAAALGVREVWLKDDGRNPTGSLKDRASAVGVAKAVEAGARVMACASTGNAAASLAGHCAAAGLHPVIFVPRTAARGKIAQLLMFGATVFRVLGSYQEAYQLCQEAVARYGWYNRNCAVNPYLIEGKKTAGLEVAEQLGWDAPDWLAVAVGDGCTIAGLYKGFTDLCRLGWIDRLPRLLAVQAEGSQGIHRYWQTGVLAPAGEETIAGGIAVGLPRNAAKAARAVTGSGGTFAIVSDAEIREAMHFLGRHGGVFAEPAAAAAIAGLRQAAARGIVGPGDRVVAVVTGNGLKDVETAMAAAGEPVPVAPDPGALAALLPAGLSGEVAPC